MAMPNWRYFLPAGCCDCCPAFRPRYTRLVDKAHPQTPAERLAKNTLERQPTHARPHPPTLPPTGEEPPGREARTRA